MPEIAICVRAVVGGAISYKPFREGLSWIAHHLMEGLQIPREGHARQETASAKALRLITLGVFQEQGKRWGGKK